MLLNFISHCRTPAIWNPMGEVPENEQLGYISKAPVPIVAEIKVRRCSWFVECYTSYYNRGQENSSAVARWIMR
jgi:hypothetical protein